MKKVIVSAPGKIHLSGEHAVVYGKPALIVATSLRLFITLEQEGKAKTLADLEEHDPYIAAILSVFESAHGAIDRHVHCTITSQIPVGAGMGSSAALAVALCGALMTWQKVPWNVSHINDLSYRAEREKHGNSSGSDPAISSHGGILWYRKELDFLKTLWLLTMKMPASFPPLLLINTGRSESTGDLVSFVAAEKAKNERRFMTLLLGIEQTTKMMTAAIHDENESSFSNAMRKNEHYLEKMGVVSPEVRSFIRKIEKGGGVAKISGAGGRQKGSGVLLVIHPQPEKVKAMAHRANYPFFQVQLGSEGVRLEGATV